MNGRRVHAGVLAVGGAIILSGLILMAGPTSAEAMGGDPSEFLMWNWEGSFGGEDCEMHSTEKEEFPDGLWGYCQNWENEGAWCVSGTAHSEAVGGQVPNIEHPEEEGCEHGGGGAN